MIKRLPNYHRLLEQRQKTEQPETQERCQQMTKGRQNRKGQTGIKDGGDYIKHGQQNQSNSAESGK
jgi:hypothetical protein